MELKSPQTIDSDILVIGGGGAGLRAAIEAKKHGVSVLLVSRSRVGRGNNTAISGSGIAAATGWREPTDSPDKYARDTVVAGRYINDQRLVEIMTRESGQQVLDLANFGVNFRKKGESFHVALMAGHTHPRNVFGDNSIGTDLTLPLRNHAIEVGVDFKEGILVTKLLDTGDAICGATGIDGSGGIYAFNAKATILATGGAGQIYLMTSNAIGSTGDGFALAYNAGLPLIGMEFVQFSVSGPNTEMFCAREGAVIRNSLDENILEKYDINDPLKMTRDAVSRAIATEILEGRAVDGMSLTLDTSPIPPERFETLRALLPKSTPHDQRHFSISLQSHFFMGGIRINKNAETSLDRLYAAGEVCGGIHGANRLGGNGLAEAFVFGRIAGQQAAQRALGMERSKPPIGKITGEVTRLKDFDSSGGEDIKELERLLKTTMWSGVAVVRNEKGMKKALEDIDALELCFRRISPNNYGALMNAIRLQNMLTVSQIVTRAALLRTESRGAHYRSDYPEENDREWLKNIIVSKHAGHMELNTAPIELTRFSSPE